MVELIRKDGEKLVIPQKADTNAGGRVLLWIGLVLMLVLLPMPVLLDIPEFHLFQILPGIFLLVGGIMAVVGKRIQIDPGARLVMYGDEPHPFDDFTAVHILTYVKEVRTQHGTSRVQRWVLTFVLQGENPEMAMMIRELQKVLKDAADENGQPLTHERRQEISAELEKMQTYVGGDNLVILDDGQELRVWQAAETLAKTLHLPLLDFCGEQLALRNPDELDMPLKDRLARGLLGVEDPGPRPEGIHEDVQGDALTFRYQLPKMGASATALTLGILGVCTGIPLFFADVVWALVCLGVSVVLLLVPVFYKPLRDHTITVTAASIMHRTGEKAEAMSLQNLEVLRVNTALVDTLNLMSDEKVIRIPLAKEHASWVRSRIHAYLAESALG